MVDSNWLNDNLWLVLLVAVWSLIWKGLALWRSARKSDKAWFVALLVINTVGVLELFYLFVFSKRVLMADKTLSDSPNSSNESEQ